MIKFEVLTCDTVRMKKKGRGSSKQKHPNYFEIHKAGCRDLDQYRKQGGAIHEVEATSIVEAVKAEVDDLNKSMDTTDWSPSDWDVMPCCGSFQKTAKAILPEPNPRNLDAWRHKMAKEKNKSVKIKKNKKDKGAKKKLDTAGRAAAKEARRVTRIEKSKVRIEKQIARLTKLGVDAGALTKALKSVK